MVSGSELGLEAQSLLKSSYSQWVYIVGLRATLSIICSLDEARINCRIIFWVITPL